MLDEQLDAGPPGTVPSNIVAAREDQSVDALLSDLAMLIGPLSALELREFQPRLSNDISLASSWRSGWPASRRQRPTVGLGPGTVGRANAGRVGREIRL